MSDITELDVVTGQEVSRKYTKSEKDALSSMKIDGQEKINDIVAKENQNKILKEEALEILQELGLTEAQAKAIAGL
jgi:hypothetical protein